MVWPEDVKAKLESLMGPAEVPERRPVGGPQMGDQAQT
jgi:hypothetical protein